MNIFSLHIGRETARHETRDNLFGVASKDQIKISAMNHTKKLGMLLMASCLMAAFLAAGCSSSSKSTKPITVERQVCFLEHVNFWDIDEFDLNVTVDIPVDASKALSAHQCHPRNG